LNNGCNLINLVKRTGWSLIIILDYTNWNNDYTDFFDRLFRMIFMIDADFWGGLFDLLSLLLFAQAHLWCGRG